MTERHERSAQRAGRRRYNRREQMRWALVILATVAAGAVIVVYRRPILELASNPEQVRAWVEQLGPVGPLGLIALNALQVVVAFVPGPVVQVVAGYLFGWFQGALVGTIGMIIGGTLAMLLARFFGRPLVQGLVGAERLMRWEQIAHLNSLPIWFILMLGPFGDIPYYIAGLTSLAIWKVIAVAAFVRTPSIILASAIGAGVIRRDSPWVVAIVALLVVLALIAIRYQRQIEQWVDQQLLQRLVRVFKGSTAEQPTPLLLAAPPTPPVQPVLSDAASDPAYTAKVNNYESTD